MAQSTRFSIIRVLDSRQRAALILCNRVFTCGARLKSCILLAMVASPSQTSQFSNNTSSTRKPRYQRPPARWVVRTAPDENDAQIARACQISPVTAAILRTRGHETVEAVRCFLDPDLCGLRDPMQLPDIHIAVERLHRAIVAKEPMLVYGDYDVDGVTSTAMLVRALGSLGANVSWRIPERHGEGYGVNATAMEEVAAQGITLVLTADCGVRDHEAVARAVDLGMDVIVTDHHEPGETLPPAIAIINPKRGDSEYAWKELSGCGVAFKLMQALIQTHWPQHAAGFWDKFIDLVALSTVADCVPLRDENRILAREGLKKLATTNKMGLVALKKSTKLDGKTSTLCGGDVGFRIGPRLNAAGRLDSPQKSLRLLLSSDAAECQALATELEGWNTQRRDVERRIVDEACALVEAQTDLSCDLAIVVVGDGWHGGVVGLVASRLAERFSRPALVFNRNGELATGSGRSFAAFDLHEVVEKTKSFQTKGGGHSAACGMTIRMSEWDDFKERVLEVASQRLSLDDCVPTVEADCEVTGRDLSLQLARDLEKLEPCGNSNEEARLVLRGAKITSGRSLGARGEHTKWQILADGMGFDAVWWRPGDRADGMNVGDVVDICFAPEINNWNGNTTLQLVVKDAKKK